MKMKKMESMVKGNKMKNMHNMRGIIIKEEITIMMRRSIRTMMKNKMWMGRMKNKIKIKIMKKKIMKRFQMLNKLLENNNKEMKMRIKMILMIKMNKIKRILMIDKKSRRRKGGIEKKRMMMKRIKRILEMEMKGIKMNNWNKTIKITKGNMTKMREKNLKDSNNNLKDSNSNCYNRKTKSYNNQ